MPPVAEEASKKEGQRSKFSEAIASEEFREPQPGVWFKSRLRNNVGGGSISFALTFVKKSERTHAAAPPFQIEPTAAGLRFGSAPNVKFVPHPIQKTIPETIETFCIASICTAELR